MKTTCVNFYVGSSEDPVLDPVLIQSESNPMRKFYIAKYKRVPGEKFWMDGFKLAKSKSWGLVASGNDYRYSFVFANRKQAEQARKELEAAE